MTLDELNALPELAAVEQLMRCCGSTVWAKRVAAGRPYADATALLDAADERWTELDRKDRLEAFGHHPRIGERQLREKFASTARWAGREQAGVESATEHVLALLATGNARYEERFGHVFLVCATGRSAQEMLDLLTVRLENEPEREFEIACGEQAKITRLRLEKLLSEAKP